MPNPLRTLTDTQLAERLAQHANGYRARAAINIEDRAEQVALEDEAARRLRVLAGLREWLGQERREWRQLRGDRYEARTAMLNEVLAELDRRLAEGQED